MGRFWETLTRTPPVVAPRELRGRTDLVFGFATELESEGWLVQGYGPDGRRIGRPVKGMSSAALATLIEPVNNTSDPARLRQFADAWASASKRSSRNAEMFRMFGEAIEQADDPA